eukprot:scaffold187387_cov17-Prasinocladus_malaysianus.AAC.1
MQATLMVVFAFQHENSVKRIDGLFRLTCVPSMESLLWVTETFYQPAALFTLVGSQALIHRWRPSKQAMS